MAEKGAHITQTAKAYKSLPSFFDAIATDTLNSYEAIKKLVDVNMFYRIAYHFSQNHLYNFFSIDTLSRKTTFTVEISSEIFYRNIFLLQRFCSTLLS